MKRLSFASNFLLTKTVEFLLMSGVSSNDLLVWDNQTILVPENKYSVVKKLTDLFLNSIKNQNAEVTYNAN